MYFLECDFYVQRFPFLIAYTFILHRMHHLNFFKCHLESVNSVTNDNYHCNSLFVLHDNQFVENVNLENMNVCVCMWDIGG